jgi:cytochrome d ubiquinol oxidase subunit I
MTMGLALLLVYLKTKFLRTGDEHYSRAACLWVRVFGITLALGVITGIRMEFRFGTKYRSLAGNVAAGKNHG